jgi:phospholipase C
MTLAATAALTLALALGTAAAAMGTTSAGTGSSHYDHVFVIVEENHGYSDVIGNPAAPNLNALADEYGIATNYYAVTHPSEPNYVALLGGSNFGVTSDNAYYTQRVAAPNLISQLDSANVSWKAYLQSLPHAGYQGICYPASCNGAPDKDPLYVSKHDGIQNFTADDNAKDWNNQVPIEQLATDLKSDNVPNFGYIVPDECHDQHGDPPYCLDSGSVDNGNLSTEVFRATS